MNRYIPIALAVTAWITPATSALPPRPPAQTIQSASDVLADFSAIPLKCIPPAILANAEGLAIIPRVLKAGFLVGGRCGHGVVLTRDRSGAWCGPTFVGLGGGSLGLQAGVESADVVLVFRSHDSLKRILAGKGKLTLGADVAIAAGPVGRQAEAGTDARLQAEIVSYSRSRGLFAGVALDGAVMVYDHVANAEYARDVRPETALLTAGLLARLTEMSVPPPPASVPVGPPVSIPHTSPEPPVVPLPAPPPPPGAPDARS
jgi:lipid-binding SYLF domain-containing protein